ncbi:MAG: glycosyltransferase family 39 protein [Victivallales bacterium]|nr:glycosyltransferase family 39 protein [Victivallales bacterium]
MSRFFSLLRRHALLSIFILSLIGLMLRLTMCACLANHPSVVHPSRQTDMATYIRMAAEISRGEWPDHFDYQPFYYTIFLPFCRLFSGDSPWGAMVLQGLLGVAAIWLAGLCAAQLFGKRAGILAAFLLAFSRVHVFYTPFMLLEVLQSFWLALILWLACQCWRRNKVWQWGLLALLVAIATLTRGNAVLLMPGLLALAVWRNWSTKAKAFALAVLLVVLFELPQLPYAIRNYHYTGRWCGASTAGDKVLALGNTPEAPPGGLEYPLTYHKWVGQSERRPEEGRVSVRTNILRWLRKDPFAVIELKFRALLMFWDHEEIPNNVSLLNEGQACFLTKRPFLLSFTIIGSLAVIGFIYAFKRMRPDDKDRLGIRAHELIIFIYMLLCSWLGTALFYNLARFRLSALPLICIAGGGGIKLFLNIGRIFKTVEDRQLRRKMLQMCSLPLVFSIFFVYSAFSSYQTLVEPAAMRILRPNGLVADFDDTMLLYDHGPLAYGGGGFNFIGVQEKGLDIVKALVIPENAPKGEAVVRFPVFLGPGARLVGALSHNSHQYTFTDADFKIDRFNKWIEIKLPQITTNENGIATFTWRFYGNEQLGLGVDRLRNYHRTKYYFATGEPLAFEAEAAMEIQWYKAK